MKIGLILLATMLLAFAVVACDGNGDDEPTATSAAPADGDAPTATSAPPDPTATAQASTGFSLPDTLVQASLTTTYKVVGGVSGAPAPGDLPFAEGAVTARWYQSGGFYVVHYADLPLDGTGPLCPGNSIETTTGFLHVSNAPISAGACEGATTLVPPPTGVRLCDGEVLYLTAIPVDVAGTLYGTIEVYPGDGSIIGLTSMASTAVGTAPEIDLSLCTTPA